MLLDIAKMFIISKSSLVYYKIFKWEWIHWKYSVFLRLFIANLELFLLCNFCIFGGFKWAMSQPLVYHADDSHTYMIKVYSVVLVLEVFVWVLGSV